MNQRMRQITTAVIAMAASVSLIAGCSSASNSQGGAASGNGTANNSPILIGNFAPYTQGDSNFLPFPGYRAGAAGAVAAINAAGGINGHPLKLDTCDTHSDPNSEVTCARQLIDDGVVADVGIFSGFSGKSTSALIDGAKLENIGPRYTFIPTGPNNVILGDNVATPAGYTALAGAGAQAVGATKIAVTAVDVPSAKAGISSSSEFASILPHFGASHVGNVFLPLTATDYAPQVSALKGLNADFVFFLASEQADAIAIKSAAEQGYKPYFGIYGGDASLKPSDISSVASQVDGKVVAIVSYPPVNATSVPGIRHFVADMAAANKAGVPDTSTSELNANAIQSWLATEMFAEVARKISGPITRESVAQAFSDSAWTKYIDGEGLLDGWTPTNGVARYWVEAIEGGKWALLKPAPVCIQPTGCSG